MKYKIGSISFIIFIALTFGVAVYQDSQKKKKQMVELPAIEDVVSGEIDIGGPPGPNKQPIQMDLNDNMQKLTVAKIIYWLSSAEYIGPTRNQFISHGGGPNEFVMKSKDGKLISIFDAVDSVSTAISNGWMVTGVSVSDEVTISNDNKILRLKSPDLKRWIETDMSKLIEDRLKEQQK